MIDRRRLMALTALSALTTAGRGLAQGVPMPEDSPRAGLDVPLHDMSVWPAGWTGSERVVMLAYPDLTALDLVGPQYMFASLVGATVQVAAKTMEPIRSDTGLVILPDTTFADTPETPDVLFVPGAISGTLAAMEDAETIDFLAASGARAGHVTSVCTGSLLLGQAGLLEGYRATSHWLAQPHLGLFGASPAPGRVVRDSNRITAGGVTAGIDFGLALIAELRGPDYARAVQSLAEYDPAPPLDAGHPQTAPAETTALLQGMLAGFDEHLTAVAAHRRRG